VERHPAAWPCSKKLAGKVFHIFEIDPCQLLQKPSKDLNVTGLSSLSAGSDKSVRQDDLLVACNLCRQNVCPLVNM